MRTRTKYDIPQYTSTATTTKGASRPNVNSPWSAFGSAANTGSTTQNVLMQESEEIIIDDPTPSRSVKYVHHTKRKFKRVHIPSADEATTLTRYLYESRSGGDAHVYSWGQYGKLSFSNVSVSYPKTISQLKSLAMHKFHAFNEVDTLLNVIESPQLVSSARSLVNLMKQHAVRTRTGRRKNALPSLASSGFLAWSFGLAPLISDINKINQSLRTIKSEMDRYVREGNREYTTNAAVNGTFSANISATGYSSNPNANNGSWWHVGFYPTTLPRLLVGVKGRRNVEYNSDAFKRLDYVIRRFIATGPASLAWEKIPFSFVADWFVNLSGVVDALDNALTGNSRTINSIWMSEKWNVIVPVYKHKQVSWTSDSDGKQTAHNELSYYHREAVSPDLSISLSGRFGKKQVALTAALLHQLVANLRVWR